MTTVQHLTIIIFVFSVWYTRVEDNKPKTCCTADISITLCRTMTDRIIKPGKTWGSTIESQDPVFLGVGKGRQSNTPTRAYLLPGCGLTHDVHHTRWINNWIYVYLPIIIQRCITVVSFFHSPDTIYIRRSLLILIL